MSWPSRGECTVVPDFDAEGLPDGAVDGLDSETLRLVAPASRTSKDAKVAVALDVVGEGGVHLGHGLALGDAVQRILDTAPSQSGSPDLVWPGRVAVVDEGVVRVGLLAEELVL